MEARFSKKTYPPWNRVKEGDDIFFMNSLEPVKAHARVEAVVQFDNLTPKRVREIIDDYKLMMAFTQAEAETLKSLYEPRRYCVLIFLTDCTEIQPIRITKNLYGSTAKWITLKDIESMRRTETIREIWDRIYKAANRASRALKKRSRLQRIESAKKRIKAAKQSSLSLR